MKKNKIQNTAASNAAAGKRLLEAAAMNREKLLLQYKTSWGGYTETMVEMMRARYGKNQITHQKSDSLFKRLLCAFVNPFTAVLFVLALISIVTDVIIVAPADRDFTSVIIVLTMVLVSGTLRFVQETRSNKSAEKLSAMVKTTTAVQRQPDGKIEIALSEVVVGDIIHLAAGDMIPADVRILQAKDLFVSQSSLTGESEPLEKMGWECADSHGNPLEMNNLAFMGSNVISGSAIGIA
ncbi:MAG: HAD-IC family P-type ATPase, partial [Ruthenibacterium sp.]